MKRFAVITGSILLSTPAFSNNHTFYELSSNLYASAISGHYAYPTDDADNTATISGLRVGGSINPLFYIEGGYVDLGNANDPDNSSESLGLRTQYVAAKPTLPMGLIDLYGRIGLHNYRSSTTNSGTSEHDYDVDFMYGFGVDLVTATNFLVGFSYTTYKFDDIKVNGFEVNLTFRP